MARASLLVKSAKKRDLQKIQETQNKQLNITRFFNIVYNALLNLDNETARDLIKHPKSIMACRDSKCQCVLHAILIPLLANDHDWAEILNEMSDQNIQLLKHCVTDAKTTTIPSNSKAEIKSHLITNVMGFVKGTVLTSVQIAEEIKRLPRQDMMAAKNMFIIMEVVDSLTDIIEELNKLSHAIDTFNRTRVDVTDKVIVADDVEEEDKSDSTEKIVVVGKRRKTWSIVELAQKLGLHMSQEFASKKWEILEKHPEYKDKISSWFSSDGRFDSEHFDELKELFTGVKAEKKKKVKSAKKGKPEGMWTSAELAKMLGFKDGNAFTGRKSYLLQKHPECADEVKSWFSENGRYFNPKYLDALKKFLRDDENEQGYEKWTFEETAQKLGMTTTTLSQRKWFLLKKYPDRKAEIQSWFLNNSKYFDSKYFDALKELLFNGKRKHNKKHQNESTISVEPEKSEVINETVVEPETPVETPVPVDTSVAKEDKKTTLTDVKAFETLLEGLQKLVDNRNKELNECDQLMVDATNEKDLKKRSELLNEATKKTQALAESQQDFESLKNMLKQGIQLKEKFAAFKTEMTEFIQSAQNVVRK